MKREDVKRQLDAYREKTCKLTGGQIYQKATEIIVMHGVADAIGRIPERGWRMIERAGADKTLEGCAQHVMHEARRTLGGHGDLPPEEMMRLITEYFLPE